MTTYRDPRDGKTWRYRCTLTMPNTGLGRISRSDHSGRAELASANGLTA